MFCGQCGSKVPNDANFCAVCGAKVGLSREKSPADKSVHDIQSSGEHVSIAINRTHKSNHIGKIIAISASIGFVLVVFCVIVGIVAIPAMKYQTANFHREKGELEKAADIFSSIVNYRDSCQLSADCYYDAQCFENAEVMYSKIKTKSQKNEFRYGVCLYETGRYEDSLYYLKKNKDYENAEQYIVQCQLNMIADAKINDVITFGIYEQDNNKDNGSEYIEWDVIQRDGSKVLLWSDKVLDYQPFNNTKDQVTGGFSREEPYISWEHSHIRGWLNNDFYNSAFTLEKDYIIQTKHETTDCKTITYSTEDCVFLFSSDEFYDLDNLTIGTMNQIPTDYAKEVRKREDCWNSCYTRDQRENKGLFGMSSLYSPGEIDSHNTVYFVRSASQLGAIRPCIWIDCSSVKID